MRLAAHSLLAVVALGLLANPPEARAASFTVDSTADTHDAIPGDGLCADVTGACTLRAASEEIFSNTPETCVHEDDTVTLDVTGTILTTQLNFTRGLCPATVTIIGPGADQLTISGGGFIVGGNAYGFGAGVVTGVTVTNAPVGLSISSTSLEGGGATLVDVVLAGNSVGVRMGPYSFLTVERSRVVNSTMDGIADDGFSAVVRVSETEITGNGGTGLVCRPFFDCTVLSSVIRENGGDGMHAGSGILQGGGLSVTVRDSTIADNVGAGVDSQAALTTLDRSTVNGNRGGGASVIGSFQVVNSTISGNRTPESGAGIAWNGYFGYELTIANATIVRNVADTDGDGNGEGGGVYVASDTRPRVQNSIIAENTGGAAPDCAGAIESAGYNLLGDTGGCTVTGVSDGNLVGIDPGLSALGDNGGASPTHALLGTSAARDAGNPAGCTDVAGTPLATDQRGAPRVQGATCDIGAYESGCGNSVVDLGEECDDGNRLDGDCCSSLCKSDPPGSPCDDGNACTTVDTCSIGACVGGPPPTCDPCEVCDAALGCTLPTASGCRPAPEGSSVVVVKNSDNDLRDILTWKWKSLGPLSLFDVGNPGTGTAYTMCLIDSRDAAPTLLASSSTPSDGLCDGAPCWTFEPRGYRYLDRALTAGGLFKMLLRPSLTGHGRIVVRGKGGGLDLPTFPLVPPVTVRLVRSDGPQCWEANFSGPLQSNELVFRARSD